MRLPSLNAAGDLPPGVYCATLSEVVQRFGTSTCRRMALTKQLERVYKLARMTGCLDKFIIFGSYVTAKPHPNDIDIILVMQNDFLLASCPVEAQRLFEHQAAQSEFSASIFWIRPDMLIQESVETFIEHWQIKRDGTQRGIVGVIEV